MVAFRSVRRADADEAGSRCTTSSPIRRPPPRPASSTTSGPDVRRRFVPVVLPVAGPGRGARRGRSARPPRGGQPLARCTPGTPWSSSASARKPARHSTFEPYDAAPPVADGTAECRWAAAGSRRYPGRHPPRPESPRLPPSPCAATPPRSDPRPRRSPGRPPASSPRSPSVAAGLDELGPPPRRPRGYDRHPLRASSSARPVAGSPRHARAGPGLHLPTASSGSGSC